MLVQLGYLCFLLGGILAMFKLVFRDTTIAVGVGDHWVPFGLGVATMAVGAVLIFT